jgi:predicted nucleic acid-binding protein
MKYLLDSDIIIDLLLDDATVNDLLDAMADDLLGITMITYMEAYEGISTAGQGSQLHARFAQLVEAMTIVPFGLRAARRCALLRAQLRRKGLQVRRRALDIMNAACAIDAGFTLVTRNSNDYRDIPGLTLFRGRFASGER